MQLKIVNASYKKGQKKFTKGWDKCSIKEDVDVIIWMQRFSIWIKLKIISNYMTE